MNKKSLIISDLLDRKICPGCGTENPASKSTTYFSCIKCEWESDEGLPTIREIICKHDSFTDCANVNLTKFLNTLFQSII